MMMMMNKIIVSNELNSHKNVFNFDVLEEIKTEFVILISPNLHPNLKTYLRK